MENSFAFVGGQRKIVLFPPEDWRRLSPDSRLAYAKRRTGERQRKRRERQADRRRVAREWSDPLGAAV